MNSESQRNAVLFDFDGTLGRSLPHWAIAYQDALRHHGITVSYEEAIESAFAKSQSEIAERLKVTDPRQFRELVWTKVKDRMALVEAYPDVLSTLVDLRNRDFMTAVVTNSRRGHVAPVLERWNAHSHFDGLVAIEDVSKGKPEPESILFALSTLKVSPTNAWMIGDSLADVNAGNAAGVKTIAFIPPENHAFNDPKLLREAKPTHIARTYGEIHRIIINHC
jgi:HAD superfamily hydrolase (TIGR01662 family)